MLGVVFCWIDRLKMPDRAPMATGSSCFRCLYELPSGPTEEMGFICYIACFVMLGVKGGGASFWGRCLRCVLYIFSSCVSCGSLEVDA